jgi:hypothetical protein
VISRERVSAGQRYDVETLRTRPYSSVYESWVDTERGRVRSVQRSGSEVLSDELTDLDEAQETPTLVADYRRRLEEGGLRIAGTATVGGRKADRLATTTETPEVPPYEAAVDAETGRLLGIRTIARYFQTARDFELLKAVPRDEDDFVVRFGPPATLSQVRPEGRRVTQRKAAREVPGAHWAGERVGGLPLRDIRTVDWHAPLRAGGEARGSILTVAYGQRLGTIIDPAVGTPTGVEVVQAANDDDARWFLKPVPSTTAPPPAGTFDLSAEFSESGQFVVATLRKPGVWLLVRAPSRRLLFEAVRALRPIS